MVLDTRISPAPASAMMRGLVDGETANVAGHRAHFSRVDAAWISRPMLPTAARISGRLQCPRGAVEDDQKPIAGGIDLLTAVQLDHVAHQRVMPLQQRLGPGGVAQLGCAVGGAGDVGHQHGRQDPIADGWLLAESAPAAPDDRDGGLVPVTHWSWPGGISNTSPGPIAISVPSSIRIMALPDSPTPM